MLENQFLILVWDKGATKMKKAELQKNSWNEHGTSLTILNPHHPLTFLLLLSKTTRHIFDSLGSSVWSFMDPWITQSVMVRKQFSINNYDPLSCLKTFWPQRPPWGPGRGWEGVRMRICPPYPHARRKRRPKCQWLFGLDRDLYTKNSPFWTLLLPGAFVFHKHIGFVF